MDDVWLCGVLVRINLSLLIVIIIGFLLILDKEGIWSKKK